MLKIGKREFKNATLNFSSLANLKSDNEYDILLMSAVIDLVDNYQSFIDQIIIKVNPKLIIIDRTLFTALDYDFWTVKDTNKNITGHKKYPLCFLSQSKFDNFMESRGFKQKDHWNTSDNKLVSKMQIGTYKGFCYER